MQNKSKKLTSRLLSALLALACVLTLLPGVAVAAETMTMLKTERDGMVLEKGAVLEDDGTYTIQLSAYATGTTTTVTQESGVPLDIVLVLDQSGSMEGSNLKALRAAVTSFVQTIEENAEEYQVDHRIAVVGFAGAEYSDKDYYYANTELFIGKKQYNYIKDGKESNEAAIASTQYKNAFQVVTDATGFANLEDSIAALAAKGGTHPELGMEMANGIFGANSNTYTKPDGKEGTRSRIVVMFTDGNPGDSSKFDTNVANKAIEKSYVTKNTYGATVYTVGLYTSASDDTTNFMNCVSSNCPSAQSMSTEYAYNEVYAGDLDTSKTYYIRGNNGKYRQVKYYGGYYSGWYYDYTKYTPKTSRDDSQNTQFYTRTLAGQVSEKYYLTTANRDDLNGIFTTIGTEIQNPSTTVTLNAESVMRDVLSDGFELPDGYDKNANITIQTAKGTTNDGQEVNFDPAETAADMKAEVNGKNINISGFDYSTKYIAPSHPGEKLIVTIRGVEATDTAITGNDVYTNEETSGIYATPDDASCIPFPQPTTILKSKTYVLDYGKPVNLASQDWGIGSVTTLNGKGMHKFTNAVTELGMDYGKVKKGTMNSLTYTPTTMNWDGYDSFYVFGKQIAPNGAINQWSKVTVMPANNVYYEDSFTTSTQAGTVGIEYSGSWSEDKEEKSGNNKGTSDPVVHGGWENADLADDSKYSDGSAHMADLSQSGGSAKATFTFSGTGVDVYSRTNMTTGTVAATLIGKTKDGVAIKKGLTVDNYAKSGDYYQIPTLSFSGLDYGEYTLTLYVTTAAEKRATYYLDGIRVYNPIRPLESDTIVQQAYGDELNAEFQGVRDLLAAGSTVFIDQDESGAAKAGDYDATEYGKYGPKNEVYLAEGQSISFKLENANYCFVGIKAPGGVTKAEVTEGQNKSTLDIGAASDLYYKITPAADGTVQIKNTGAKLLSITKVRTTAGGTVTAANADELVAYANAFDTLPVVEYGAGTVDVEIENPEIQELGDGSIAWGWLEKIFKGIRDLLRP